MESVAGVRRLVSGDNRSPSSERLESADWSFARAAYPCSPPASQVCDKIA